MNYSPLNGKKQGYTTPSVDLMSGMPVLGQQNQNKNKERKLFIEEDHEQSESPGSNSQYKIKTEEVKEEPKPLVKAYIKDLNSD